METQSYINNAKYMHHMCCTKRKNPPKILQRARKSPNYQYLVLCVYQQEGKEGDVVGM
jgi:hypothetical protein